jgi:hypothetical protein
MYLYRVPASFLRLFLALISVGCGSPDRDVRC